MKLLFNFEYRYIIDYFWPNVNKKIKKNAFFYNLLITNNL